MIIPEYSFSERRYTFPEVSALWVQNFLDTYQKGIVYASPMEVQEFELAFPYITFWLLPNDNLCGVGNKKYFAVVN